jgi:predicted acetyltransferase
LLSLVEPDIKYKKQFIDMMDAWKASGESPFPWMLTFDYSNFEDLVQRVRDLSKGIGIPEGLVPCSVFWALEDELDKIVGVVNIRHYLNSDLYKTWGYIGYGVRPDERNKGYATAILKLALQKCRDLPVKKVLLGCYKDSEACSRTILKNGGVLENEYPETKTGRMIQRFWVPIQSRRGSPRPD